MRLHISFIQQFSTIYLDEYLRKKEFAEFFPSLVKDSDYIHSVYKKEAG